MSKAGELLQKMNEDLEFKLRWGAFCKSIVQELDTAEISLIGVLPGLKVAAQVETDLGDKAIFLPIPLWLHVNFDCKQNRTESAQVNIEIALSLNNNVHTQMVPLDLLPSSTSAVLNIRVNAPGGIPLRQGDQILKASFKYGDKILGEFELPITAEITAISKGVKA